MNLNRPTKNWLLILLTLLISPFLITFFIAVIYAQFAPARKASIRNPVLQKYFENCWNFAKLENSKKLKVGHCKQNSDEVLPNSYSKVEFDKDETIIYFIYLMSPEKSYRFGYYEKSLQIQEFKP